MAQQHVNIERFVPALDNEGFLGLQATRTPGSELWNLGLFFSYGYDPFVVSTREEESVSAVEHRLTSFFSAQMGIGGRAAVAMDLPVLAVQSGEPMPGEQAELPSSALGDPRVLARYRFWGDDADEETEHHDGPGVALQAGVALPAGRDDALLGEGALRTEFQLLADFHLLGAGLGAGLGWLHRFEPRDFYTARFRDDITFAAALKVPIPWFPQLVSVLELRGATDAGAPFSDSATTPVETNLGGRIGVGEVMFTAAVGTGVGGGIGTPSVRAIVGMWWTPRSHDADQDGIEDDDDKCPPLAEDFDGFQDHDGCPDPDNDNDWIPDLDDLCPNEPAEEGRDQDEDGCTDN